MALTAELVARVHRIIEDPGPLPGMAYQSDDDYDAMVETLVHAHPEGDGAWLFAFGSLIWKPECEFTEERRGTVHGWHRAFCFEIMRYRGTPEHPGLMMSLDRGGQCQGMLYRLPAGGLREQLHKLCRRETTLKPPNTVPRWITVTSGGVPLRAIAFVINRESAHYVGRLSPERISQVLAQACGHWGSGAEYLFHTVCKLEEYGIHDRYLWRLQQLVAERIAAEQGPLSGDKAGHPEDTPPAP